MYVRGKKEKRREKSFRGKVEKKPGEQLGGQKIRSRPWRAPCSRVGETSSTRPLSGEQPIGPLFLVGGFGAARKVVGAALGLVERALEADLGGTDWQGAWVGEWVSELSVDMTACESLDWMGWEFVGEDVLKTSSLRPWDRKVLWRKGR